MNQVELYHTIHELICQNEAFVIATVVGCAGSAPQSLGAKLVVLQDGRTFGTVGGGAVENFTIERARTIMNQSFPEKLELKLREDLGMYCGGNMDILLEPVNISPQLIIFGAGHVGKALATQAKHLGFVISVIDDRQELANPNNIPAATTFFHTGPEALPAQLHFDAATAVVIATRSHTIDQEFLRHCVEKPLAYIGMVASRNKWTLIRKQLLEAGISESALNRVKAPIGIDINSITPEEIAISILAQIITEKNKGRK
jgi:xanthine dehydrogenase accessory factor